MRRIAALIVQVQAFEDDGETLTPLPVNPFEVTWAQYKAGALEQALDSFIADTAAVAP